MQNFCNAPLPSLDFTKQKIASRRSFFQNSFCLYPIICKNVHNNVLYTIQNIDLKNIMANIWKLFSKYQSIIIYLVLGNIFLAHFFRYENQFYRVLARIFLHRVEKKLEQQNFKIVIFFSPCHRLKMKFQKEFISGVDQKHWLSTTWLK